MEATVIQREDTPSSEEFYFVHSGELSRGAFLEFENNGTVISRISEVHRSNQYFDDPESVSEVSREQMSERFPVEDWEVSMGRAVIMGKFRNDKIERVDSSPSPGDQLRKAETDRVRKFLGLEEGGIELGSVQQQDVGASLNMTDTLQKHFAILAQSGAGKSYTASVLLEELLDADHSPSILVVDPHGDYTCFAGDEGYMKDVRVFRDSEIQVAVNSLSAEKLQAYFDLTEPQRREVAKAFSELESGENSDYGLKELEKRIEEQEMDAKTRYVLLDKIREMKAMKLFGKTNSPSGKDIEPGKLNILDLSGMINRKKKQLITAFFGRHFFRQRRNGSIPPFLYLLEEAHNFAPESDGSTAVSKNVIEKMAREGRKFHASIGLISQRPVRLSTTALSQCNTKLIMRVTNPNDLEHIAQSSEGITSDVKDQIPGLKTGEAIVMGEAVNHPTFIDVRQRKSRESESGKSLEEALEEWRNQEEQMEEDVEAFM